MAGLAPDLQHLLFWMSNSVELLYFIQQRCPLYMQSLEEELDVTGTAGRCAAWGGPRPSGCSGLREQGVVVGASAERALTRRVG